MAAATICPRDRPPTDPGDVTLWPAQAEAGSPDTSNRLFSMLYGDLRSRAAGQLRREDAGHTLGATALAHEAWFRLTEQTRTRWASRGHFLSMASVMMRRILVNHTLSRHADKRFGAKVSLTLTEAHQVAAGGAAEVVRVHDALLACEQVDARAAKVVEMKFFGGLENEEIAAVLDVSLATVKRDWVLARARLYRELAAG